MKTAQILLSTLTTWALISQSSMPRAPRLVKKAIGCLAAPADYPGVVYQQRFVEGRMRPVNLQQADANLIRYLATGYRTKNGASSAQRNQGDGALPEP